MRIVDLTRELAKDSPRSWTDLAFHTHGSRSNVTRVEVSSGKTIDMIELSAFVKDAVVLDLSHRKLGFIDDEDLEAAEEGAGLALREGEVALIHTGWQETAQGEGEFQEYPALSENGAAYLEFKRLAGVGIDTPNLDRPNDTELKAHSILLRSGVFVLENLCNMKEIDQPRFRLIALPLKIKASSSPVRALAILEEMP